jgi:hypothetical protein
MEVVVAGDPLNPTSEDNVFVRYEGKYAIKLPYNHTLIGSTAYGSAELLRQGILALLNSNSCAGGGGAGGTVSSVGLSMPSGFSVASSPVTTSGTIAVTGAGSTAQYIRGDGSLATTPVLTSEWHLLGNSGTTAGTNFVGTTDNIAVVIKSNGLQVMKLWPDYRIVIGDSSAQNIFIGPSAGANNTTAYKCVFLGTRAGFTNSSGRWNTFVGDTCGFTNSTGDQNTAIGHATLMKNNGSYNTAVGVNALEFGTAMASNVGVGVNAGRNLTGSICTIVGMDAAPIATSAEETDAFGSGALAILSTGDYNTALGRGAGSATTTGAENVYVGNACAQVFSTSSSNNCLVGKSLCDAGSAVRNYWNGMGSYAGGNLLGDNVTVMGYRAGNSFKLTATVTGGSSAYIGGGFASQANELVLGGQTYALGMIAPLAGAQGTGTGTGGDIIFKVAPAGATTNAVSNALAEVARFRQSKILNISGVPDYADNAAAVSGGLVAGDVYRTSTGGTSTLKIVE